MSENDITLWGIHAGRTGDADTLFLKGNCIAIGWDEVGDLSKLPATRDGFKSAVSQAYPNKKAGAIPNNAGQLFRFTHEMAEGDLVAYPSKGDRHVHLGRITGAYAYDTSGESRYPNRRSVEWLKDLPRTRFSQGALYEIGSALSLFQVKNYTDEFLAALSITTPDVGPPEGEDETVGLVAEEIEETTRDFVLKRLATELKGHPFSHFVAHLLNQMGYHTRVAPEGPDGGVDIVAHKDELGFEPPIVKVQVKSGEGSVGDPVVSALYGKVSDGEFGLLVTLGTLTSAARAFAAGKSNLRLIGGEELVGLILQHYDSFDSAYKRLLPLKQVFIPQSVEEENT